jgi:hypothetical protein
MVEWRYNATILDLVIRGKWVVSFRLQLLYLWGKDPGTHCWAAGPVCTLRRREKCLAPARNLPLAVQSIAHCYTDRVAMYLFIYDLFNSTFNKSAYIAQNKMISKQWIETNVEGINCGLIWVTIPAFTWRDFRELWRTSESIAGLWDKITTWDFPDIKQEYSTLKQNVQLKHVEESSCFLFLTYRHILWHRDAHQLAQKNKKHIRNIVA